MARIYTIFPPDYTAEANFTKYQTAENSNARKKTFESAQTHLSCKDIELCINCISECAVWETNDGDHYPTFYQNSKIYLETGPNSRIMIASSTHSYYQRLFLYPTDETSPFRQNRSRFYHFDSGKGIAIDIFGARAVLPLDVNVADVHTAVMLCDYAIEQLRKMRPEEAKSSPLFALKQSLEADLKAMKNGKIKTLTTNIFDYIDHETYIKVQQRAENRAKILAMIEAKIIPPETKDKKYPLDSEKLDKILPAVQQKYQMHLAKQERKALIKQQRKELKLARIEKRKQLKEERQKRKEEKAKQKKELEDLKQSINEAQIL